MIKPIVTIVIGFAITFCISAEKNVQPHIVFILADDLGWNDVGFHGSSQIPTPNIDALAYSGVILDNYYVTPICTPTRSAIMTGKYPIHTGMQHTVLYAAEPRGLPLEEKILPQYLKDLGYSTHIVGKWHLGHYKKEYTPLYRGFDSHTGYWTGHHDYFDHTATEEMSWGFDIRRGMDLAYDLFGQYTTDIVTKESVRLIQNHNHSSPLFLYVAHAAVHSGNPYNPLPAPDEVVAKMNHIKDFNRRKFAAMVTKLDDSVGEIVKALQSENILKNSVIIFSTDNGGPAAGFNMNAASNWPLRGVKNTLWEGGVRGAGFIWSPRIEKRQRVARQKMHVTDWLPTLLSIAGDGKDDVAPFGDGYNLWPALSADETSPRKYVLHNIDDIWGSAALTMGNFKLIKGTNYEGEWDYWYGPTGSRNVAHYNVSAVMNCDSGQALAALDLLPNLNVMTKMRLNASVNCNLKKNLNIMFDFEMCQPQEKPCLFNLSDDPCELVNIADQYPLILEKMLKKLDEYNATAVPPGNLPLSPLGDPTLWGHCWTNFGDYFAIP